MTSYLLDTNVLRYRGGNSLPQIDVDDFWNNELSKDENDVCIPLEVKRELEVQYPKIEAERKYAQLSLIRDRLVPNLEVVSIPDSTEAEHWVRLASSYLYNNFNIPKPATIRNPNPGLWDNYPGVSDARILLTAYHSGCVLATYNINDFMLLLVLEERVYNPVDNCYYAPINTSLLQAIYNDSTFMDYRNKIEDFLYKYE